MQGGRKGKRDNVKELLDDLKKGKTVNKDELRRRMNRVLLEVDFDSASVAAPAVGHEQQHREEFYFGFNIRWFCSLAELPGIPWVGSLAETQH